MQKMDQASAQRHRVNRVINFIHANLDYSLDLEALAKQACLSKFHFSRIFKNFISQSPLQYLWRVRLERAARKLWFDGETSITKIAYDCGFSSSQVFSQSFKSQFGIAPRSYRTQPVWRPSKLAIENQFETQRLDQVRIEQRSACRVAYICCFGPYDRDQGSIPDAFSRLNCWATDHNLASNTAAKIGICPDNRRVTPDAFCSYDACVAVPDSINEDNVVSVQTIPAGRYAVLSVRCPNAQILAHWEWMASNWRLLRGKTYEQRWSYELYHANPAGTADPMFGVDLCLRLG